MNNELNSGKKHIVKRWAGYLKEKLLEFDFMALFVSFVVACLVLFGLGAILVLIASAVSLFGPGGFGVVVLGGIIWAVAFSIMSKR
jgi:hypothetical protein